MNTQSTYLEKPTLVNVIAWMTLAAGIVNILWGLGASATALFTIVGICCIPFTILPSILGIFEILYASKLLNNPPQVTQPATTIAVLEIACILTGNVFAMVVGILSLVFYNDQTVKDYFARLNGMLPPEPIVPVTPAPVPPAPVAPSSPVDEPLPSPLTGEVPPPLDETIVSRYEPSAPSDTDTGISEPLPSPLTEQETPPPAEPANLEPEPPEDPDKPQRSE